MRIAIFAHPNCLEVEKKVNNWLIQNEETCEVLDMIYMDNGVHFSILIKYAI